MPTGDDIARFERDLCADGGAAIGATIRTFASLFDEIAVATAASIRACLTQPQRLALIRAAVGATRLSVLRRSSHAPGFASALDLLIAELQAALVSPADLRSAAAGVDGSADLGLEVAALYGTSDFATAPARSDAGQVAVAAAQALRASPEAWEARPVLIPGFDDLTEAQLDVVRVLAGATDVTIAVNYADRRALAARAGLLARLEDEGGTTVRRLEFDPAYTDKASLRQLDRELFEPAEAGARRRRGAAARVRRRAGRGRGGRHRGRATAGRGVAPDDIVVAFLRHPAVDGPLLASVMREQGIPVALDAHLPLTSTAVGRSLLALCRAASPAGSQPDVLAHLRSDTAFRPSRADWDGASRRPGQRGQHCRPSRALGRATPCT